MSFLDFFRRAKSDRHIETKNEGPVIGLGDVWAEYGAVGTAAGVAVNQVSALRCSVILACVEILARDVSRIPLRIYERFQNGERIPAEDHYLHRLFQQPNDYMDRMEWLEHTMFNLLLWGNSYSIILRDDYTGIPYALIPVNSSQVTIYESPVDTNYYYFVARNSPHELAVLRNVPQKIHSEDVLHIRWASFIDSLWGESRLALARETIGLSLGLEESVARLIGTGVRPAMVLETDRQMSAEAKARLLASIQQTHGGPRRSGGTMVLEEGLKAKPTAFSSTDAQILETRRFEVEQCARLFSMPLYKLSIGETQPGSSLLQLDAEYTNSTLAAWGDRIVSRLVKTFEIDETHYEVSFDYESFLKADLQTRINTGRVGFLGSIYTINENRAVLGLPAQPGGDKIYVPSNMVPLGSSPTPNAPQSAPGSDQTGRPGEGGDGENPELDPADLPPTI